MMNFSDWEATNEAIEEQVARESYLQWLRDNERRNSSTAPKLSSTATSSSATITSGELRTSATVGTASPKACCSKHVTGNSSNGSLKQVGSTPIAQLNVTISLTWGKLTLF